MKTTTRLFLFALLMQAVMLINVTIFNSEWDGIMMAVNTLLFLLICITYATDRMKK